MRLITIKLTSSQYEVVKKQWEVVAAAAKTGFIPSTLNLLVETLLQFWKINTGESAFSERCYLKSLKQEISIRHATITTKYVATITEVDPE